MTSRAVIFGGNGQLGRELQTSLPAGWACEAPARAQLDIADADSNMLTSELRRLRPEVVINAAAYTAVDLAESEPEQAHLANAVAPAKMASVCADLNIRLIHISTDFVFDGTAAQPYLPEHECAQVNDNLGNDNTSSTLNYLNILGDSQNIIPNADATVASADASQTNYINKNKSKYVVGKVLNPTFPTYAINKRTSIPSPDFKS